MPIIGTALTGKELVPALPGDIDWRLADAPQARLFILFNHRTQFTPCSL